MGFATFHFAWGKVLPLSAYPTARVAYFRWHWSDLEPEPGVFNFALIDQTIAKARAKNQDLAFRIMPGIPKWLADMGVGQVGSGVNVLPDQNHPLFVSYHERLIQAMGERYAASIDIDHVDIGSIGCWGEWNSACCPSGLGDRCKSYMATELNQRATVNWYYKYFRGTPLVALAEGTGYANTLGAGWRGDCFGDLGNFSRFWNHMNNIYPPIVAKPEVNTAWQRGPVEFESCGSIPDWYKRGYNIDKILQKGLDWHVSVFNGKDAQIPSAWRPKFDAWLKKMGYRFVLAKLTHSNDVDPGGNVQVGAVWVNRGVAPAYRAWPIAYRLRNSSGAVVTQWKSGADVRKFLPGTWTWQDTFRLPATIPAGTYSLDVAILREDSSRAYVELANVGKMPDLWFAVSRLRVGKNSTGDGGGAVDSATFTGVDTTTVGNWNLKYGAEGYNVVNTGLAYSAAAVDGSGFGYMTWTATTTEARALRVPGSPVNRIASAYQSASSFDIRLRFNDAQPHKFAMYFLDWNTSNARSQKVEVLSSAGAVLDIRNVTAFSAGKYLVWNLSGSVTIRVTNNNPASTAVVSGLFIGGPRPAAGSATFVRTDTTTKGNWKGTYGKDGYMVVNNRSSYPSYVTNVAPSDVKALVWQASTTDARGLRKAESTATDRIAAAWSSAKSFTLAMSLNGNTPRQFGMYLVDWDRKSRKQQIDIYDANGLLLDSRTVAGFGDGQYLVWNVSGKIFIRVTNGQSASTAVLSGLFFR